MSDWIKPLATEIVTGRGWGHFSLREQQAERVAEAIRTAHAPFREKVEALVEAVDELLSEDPIVFGDTVRELQAALRAVKEAMNE